MLLVSQALLRPVESKNLPPVVLGGRYLVLMVSFQPLLSLICLEPQSSLRRVVQKLQNKPHYSCENLNAWFHSSLVAGNQLLVFICLFLSFCIGSDFVLAAADGVGLLL